MAAKIANAGVFIVGAARTACGSFGGKLRQFTATDLGTFAAVGMIKNAGIDPKAFTSVVFGNVQQTSGDAAYLARHVALRAGAGIPTPGVTVNRLCGSGFQAVINAAQEVLLGESTLVLAGGTESMSQAPFALRTARFDVRLGKNMELEDTLWAGLTDSLCKTAMGRTAENLAEKYNITRADADAFAVRSQQRWGAANAAGVFKAEIVPVPIKGKKGDELFAVDEHPRPESTVESIGRLPTVFKKDGSVTAASSSGICDGGAALAIAGDAAVRSLKLKPLVRVVGWGVAGVEPTEMGIGPVPAIRALLAKANLTLADIDLVEVNEAFASQTIAVARELKIDEAKLNVNGGAIAIGHPLGMSGARILTHLTHELRRRKGKYAIGSACIGGGQGIAVLLENVA